jgi:DNA-binding NarL/FixJ family response regulator
VRVILADDAMLFREGTARILTEAGFEIAGQAANADELLDLVRRDPPDVAVIDIRMPPNQTSEGIEAAVEIRQMSPEVGLLLLSQHVEAQHATRLITEFGTSVGYLLKDRVSDLDSFAGDVRRVAAGGCVIDPELVARLVARKREGDPLAALTERERSVLGLMAQGRSNSALSAELCLSTKTVEAHVRSIFTKLDLAPDAGDHRRVLAVLAFLRS